MTAGHDQGFRVIHEDRLVAWASGIATEAPIWLESSCRRGEIAGASIAAKPCNAPAGP
ncbi:hypothetical protein ABIB00_004118 [Bradyrhizobium sp. LB14.3]